MPRSTIYGHSSSSADRSAEGRGRLMFAMDLINARDGHHTLKSAACGLDNKAWKMRQELKSKRFLTGWSELAWVG